jgi:predicted SprT family Zn-dependent metalloprotease
MNKNAVLMQAFSKACYDIERAGITIGTVDRVTINTRATRRWGQCHRKPDGHFEINVSDRLFTSTNDGLIETVIHELLHTCDGCFSHTGKWLAYANKMNALYGYHIKRTASYADVGVKEDIKNHKYHIKCEKCGHVFYRDRWSKLIERPQDYRCKCGGTLKIIKGATTWHA